MNPSAVARLVCLIIKSVQEADCTLYVNIKINYKVRLFDAKV